MSSLCAEACGRAYTSKALVLSTPEYHVSFSSVIKLVLENLGFPSVLSGKPIVLLGVAAWRRISSITCAVASARASLSSR